MSAPSCCDSTIIPTFIELASTWRIGNGADGCEGLSAKRFPPIVRLAGTSTSESAVNPLTSMAAAATNGFITEPSSKLSTSDTL